MDLTESDLQRFWAKVGLATEGGCRLWLACLSTAGYGKFGHNGRTLLAHRIALQLAAGAPPEGKTDAAHSCRNRTCVEPSHLRWASRKENLLDRERDGTVNRGERNGKAVLTAEQVKEIRFQYALGGVTQRRLGVRYGVSRATIGLIVNGKNWSHLQVAS